MGENKCHKQAFSAIIQCETSTPILVKGLSLGSLSSGDELGEHNLQKKHMWI